MARNLRSWWHRWLNRLTPALRARPRQNPWRQRPCLEALEERVLLTTYIVNTTSDSASPGAGLVSFRQALGEVVSGDTIDFNISSGNIILVGSGGAVAAPESLTATNVTINGINEANNQPIELQRATGLKAGQPAIQISGDYNIVSSLMIDGFGQGITIVGQAGTTVGVGNTIGGTAAGAGNILIGNSDGLLIGAAGTVVENNYIGTDASSDSGLGNTIGI